MKNQLRRSLRWALNNANREMRALVKKRKALNIKIAALLEEILAAPFELRDELIQNILEDKNIFRSLELGDAATAKLSTILRQQMQSLREKNKEVEVDGQFRAEVNKILASLRDE